MTQRRGAAAFEFAELFGLSALAIAQPTLDLLGKNVQLFIAWRASVGGLFALLAVMLFAPPLCVWLVVRVIERVREPAAAVAHLVGVGGFAALMVAGALRHVGATVLVVVAALAAGAAVAYARHRLAGIRSVLRVLGVAPPLFAALFLATTPVLDVVRDANGAHADVTPTAPARIVMITFDEFPLTSLLDGRGNIDAQLYPNFAALAKQSTWYRNDTTVSPFTETAVPAILTGRYPKASTTVPHVSQYPENLFTLLRGAYDLDVHEAVTELCPSDAPGCTGRRQRSGVHSGVVGMIRDAAQIWRDFLRPEAAGTFDPSPLGAADRDALGTGRAFLAGLQATDRPELDFLHVLLPHFPWHYLPDGLDYNALPPHTLGLDGQNWATQVAAERGRQRHLLQAGAADTFVGELLLRLIALHQYDDTMIVVTADHGVAFDKGLPIRGVARATYPDIMWTPLFVKYPHQTHGGPDDRVARSIDIVPTIADTVGIRLPWNVDGRSLRSGAARDADHGEPRRLLDWERNALHPAHGDYLEFDGRAGFATVLATRAVPGNPYDRYRRYRLGPDGALVGGSLPAGQVVEAPPARRNVTIDQSKFYGRTSPYGPKVPWADVHGYVDAPVGTALVVTLGGTVAGSFETVAGAGGRSEFWGVLPSWLFRLGPTDVRVYAATGRGADRRFVRLSLDR